MKTLKIVLTIILILAIVPFMLLCQELKKMAYSADMQALGFILGLLSYLPIVIIGFYLKGRKNRKIEKQIEDKMKQLGLDPKKNWQEYYRIKKEFTAK